MAFNAEGNVQQANLIAQKIASDKNIIGVLAVGTLAAQTMTKAEKSRPITFAAVSDPKVLGETSTNLYVHNIFPSFSTGVAVASGR